MGEFGPEQSEEGRTEQHSGDHLGDDLGLADIFARPADDLANRKDDRELKKEMN
jgi:hypothetical protein